MLISVTGSQRNYSVNRATCPKLRRWSSVESLTSPRPSHFAKNGPVTASSGLRYICNPPGAQVTIHQHMDIGQGEVNWDEFFGGLAAVGFDGIVTSCVFTWEERADELGPRPG